MYLYMLLYSFNKVSRCCILEEYSFIPPTHRNTKLNGGLRNISNKKIPNEHLLRIRIFPYQLPQHLLGRLFVV